MAVGHLLSEGIVKSIDEIEEVTLKETENTCIVKLKPNIKVEDRVQISRLHARVITSACGSGSPYQYKGKVPKVESNLTVKAQVIFDSVNQLNFKAEGFRKTGGFMSQRFTGVMARWFRWLKMLAGTMQWTK